MGRRAEWFEYDRRGRGVWRRRLSSGGFRSSDLNLAGWAAVLVPGLVLGLVVAAISDRPPVLFAVGGMALTWLVALGIDHLAWQRIPFGTSTSALTIEQAQEVASALRQRGLQVDLERRVDEEDGSPSWTIRSINRHRRAVHEAMRAVAQHR